MAKTSRWSLQDAKAQFSEVVRRSLDEGPQVVTRNGEETAVVLSVKEYSRLTHTRRESLAHFLARSPLSAVELDFARSRDTGRKVKL